MIETKFKDSELGLIPEDWEENVIGSIGEPIMCRRILKSQTTSTGDIPFYKIGTFGKIADSYINASLWRYLITHYHYPKNGDVLLSAAGTIGRCVKFDGSPSYYQDSNIVWIDNDESKLKNSLLYYLYSSLNWNVDSSTISRLYNSNLKSTKIVFPNDLDEQERIAEALSDVDALIKELDALIEKKRMVLKATMQDLLTARRRLPGFSDPWQDVKLENYSSITMGQSPSSNYYNTVGNGLPLIQGNADIFNRKSIIRNYTSQVTKTCESGDIIMSVRAPVGTVSIASNKSCIGRGVCAFKANKFLYYMLLFMENRWSELSSGSTFDSVNGKQISEFKIFVPTSLSEQRAIAEILSDIDSEIAELEKKKEKYTSIRQGMMQQLLTGKIRLI